MEPKNGLTALNMRESGKKTRHLGRADFSMQMVTFMKDSGLTIKLMASESTFIITGQSTKENGLMISSMDGGKRHGPMELITKAIMKTAKNMEKENCCLLMDPHTRVSST